MPQGRLDLPDEDLGILGHVELRVITVAPGIEVGWQVKVRIAVAVRADHPDFLGAQSLAQCAQHTDFIVDTIHPFAAVGVLLYHDAVPFLWNDAFERNLGSIVILLVTVPVRLQNGQCLDEGAMHSIVGLEGQCVQYREQHAPIVVTVG